MESIKIGGRELPFKRAMSMYRKFDNKFKSDGISSLSLDVSKMRIEHILYLFYYGVEAGFKANGEKCDISIEWLEDNLEMDDMALVSQAIGGEQGQKKT